MTESTTLASTTNAGGKSKRAPRSKRGKVQIRTKIVVRRLPANLPEQVFLDSIKTLVPEDNLTRAITWFSGKVSKNPVKGNTFARAYLYFKTEPLALEFLKAYHGHLFKDRQGNEGRAHVELSPFQKAPRDKKKVDIRQGTIEKDPDYKAFLESLNAEPVINEKEPKLSNTEMLLKESAANPKSTPLLEALRAQKAAAQAAAQAARQARLAGKAAQNAAKGQITILSKNAKDKAAKQQAKLTKKTSQQQQQQTAPSTASTVTAGSAVTAVVANEKPKRERRRRDRKSERAAKASATGAMASGGGSTATTTVEIAKEPGPIQILKPKATSKPDSNTPAEASTNVSGSVAAGSGSAPAQPESGNLPRRQRNTLRQQHARDKDENSSKPSAGIAEGLAPPKASGEGAEAAISQRRTRRGRGGDKAKRENAAAAASGSNQAASGGQAPAGAPVPGPAASAEGGDGKPRSVRRRGRGGGGGGGQKQVHGQQQG